MRFRAFRYTGEEFSWFGRRASAPTDRSVLNGKTVFVGVGEALCGMLQGQEFAAYFQKNWVGTEIRYLLFQGVPNLENTVGALQRCPSGADRRGLYPGLRRGVSGL